MTPMGNLHDISVAIGGLQESVKSLGQSIDRLRKDIEADRRDVQASIKMLERVHYEQEGSRRTVSLLWGSVGGIVAAIVGVVATKLGLR